MKKFSKLKKNLRFRSFQKLDYIPVLFQSPVPQSVTFNCAFIFLEQRDQQTHRNRMSKGDG